MRYIIIIYFQIFNGKNLISDPTYLVEQGKVTVKAKVIRAVCHLEHSIPDTIQSNGGQIILTQKQLNRKHGNYFR